MKFINDFEEAKNKIIDLYPEFKDSDFKSDESGWCNYVVKVDSKYIFRFSRNDDSYNILNIEDRVLSELRKNLPPNIKVPNFIYKNLDSDLPFVGYEMIGGEFLNRKKYNALSKESKENFMNNITIFLNALHSLNINDLSIPKLDALDLYKDLYDEIKLKCYNVFDKKLIEKTDELFENYFKNEKLSTFIPRCAHGDLSLDHIIITEDGLGVIDFGDVRVFDPAYDLIWAYDLDKDLFNKILYNYKYKTDKNIEIRIKEFYSKRTAYYQVLFGIDNNNKEAINIGIKRLKKRFGE